MEQKKYIGMDVHQPTISVVVRDAAGKLVSESITETKATTILEFVRGIRGSLWITFEQTTNTLTWEAWIRPDVLDFPNENKGYVSYMGKCESYSATCDLEARIYGLSTDRPNRLSVGFIHPPGSIRMPSFAPNSLTQNGRVALHPPPDGDVIHRQAALCHHFFQVAVAEGVPQIPPNTQNDDHVLEVSPSKQRWSLLVH